MIWFTFSKIPLLCGERLNKEREEAGGSARKLPYHSPVGDSGSDQDGNRKDGEKQIQDIIWSLTK